MIVEPVTFTIPAGGIQSITITIDVSQAPYEAFDFGRVTFATNAVFSSGKAISSVAIPFAVQATGSTMPNYARYQIGRDHGVVYMRNVQTIAVEELVTDMYGLTQGTVSEIQLLPDPTPYQVYDDLSQVYWKSFTVPANSATRYVFEVLETTAGDLDLYFGLGATPSAATVLDWSATEAALEYLNERMYYESTYTYWVLVQNWAGTITGDSIRVSEGLVVCQSSILGYRVFNLIRASAVVNRQSTLTI